MTDAEFADWLANHSITEAAAPVIKGPKLEFMIADQAGHAAWCAERGMTVAEYEEHLRAQLKPTDPFDPLVMDGRNGK